VRRGFSRLFGMLGKGDIAEEEFRDENQQRREQVEALGKRLAELQQRLQRRRGRQADLERARTLLQNFDQLWGTMSQAERRQLLLQVDSHMTLRREGEDLVLTISPGFADPIQLTFARRRKRQLGARNPEARLTPRQMALLCCWGERLSFQDIGANWDVRPRSVRGMAFTACGRLGAKNLDEAVELVRERLDQCRSTLPLGGRMKPRRRDSSSPLSAPLLAVLRLMAAGQGCIGIAQTLGKDKSTISRQMQQVCWRLGVEERDVAAAVAKAKELGLVP